MRKIGAFLLIALPAFWLVSCDLSAIKTGDGKWFGYVMDARTGAKINFFGDNNDTYDGDATNQIYAVVEGKTIFARPCEEGDINETNGITRAGCFVVSDLPTDVFIPVFVKHAGYHLFAGRIEVDHTLNNHVILAGRPAEYGNVRLFTTGIDYDYTIQATVNGVGVEDVIVRCVYESGTNVFDSLGDAGSGDWVTVRNDFNPVVTGTTDSSGYVTLAGTSLTKGARYECHGTMASTLGGSVVSYSATNYYIVVGVDAPTLIMSMVIDEGAVTVVATNYGDSSQAVPGGLDGPLTIYFNRPISVLPESVNCQYSLQGVGLPDNSPPNTVVDGDDDGTNGPDSVEVTVASDGMSLTVVPDYFTTNSEDKDVSLTYGGIFVTATSGPFVGVIYDINGGMGDPYLGNATSGGVGTPFGLVGVGGDCANLNDTMSTDIRIMTTGTGTALMTNFTGLLVNP